MAKPPGEASLDIRNRPSERPWADGNVPCMPIQISPKRLLELLIALALGCLALTPAAGATTGIEVTIPVKVTRRNGFDQPVTLTFRIGYRKTRTLAKGAAEDFYFTFHVVGKIRWSADDVKAPGASGIFDVKLAKTFSGG